MQPKDKSLSQRAVSGTIWVFLERIALQLFQFVTTIILARILGPKEFGLVALTSIFIAVSITFIDSGFTKALIQKKDTNRIDESTIFYFNIFVSFLFVLLVNLFAGMIANYFDEPRLESVLRVLSLTLILFALRQIQQVVLTKQLDFKLQFKANVIGTICSGIVGIVLAYKGFGVWALVIQSICEGIIKGVMFWLVSSWRPLWVFSKDSFMQFYKFGLNLFFNDLLKSVSENMYGLLVGKYYSSYDLGLYDRANKLASLVITNFQFSIQRVTFPLFSKVQNDLGMLKDTVRKSLDLIMLLVVPAMVLLALVAQPLTIILLSEKWIAMVPYVQLFCLFWIFFPFSGVNNHLVLALGHSNIILRQSFYIYGLQIILLLATIKFGILIIILGQILATIGRQIILIYYARILIGFGFKEQFSIFARHLILALLSALLVYFLKFLFQNNYALLFSQSIIGGLIYIGLSYVFNRRSIDVLIKQFIKSNKVVK